jgi:hypothetical protein
MARLNQLQHFFTKGVDLLIIQQAKSCQIPVLTIEFNLISRQTVSQPIIRPSWGKLTDCVVVLERS